MSRPHARLSASGSARWMNCPGSVKAEEGLPNSSSIFAEEGTAAHELADLCLSNWVSPFDKVGTPLPSGIPIEVTREMAANVQMYIDYVRQFKGDTLIEQRVDFSDWVPGGFGTSDVINIHDGTLRVIDLKYGKGVRVDAFENTQALLYALGAVSDYGYIHDIRRVAVAIVQPRLDHISEWELSCEELMRWGERIKTAAEEAASDNPPRHPGEKQCQWCKAKATCKELLTLTERTLLADLDDMSPALLDTLTNGQLKSALDNKKLIVGWLDAVESLVVSRLTSGEGFDGYKLVAGRTNRTWASEGDAETMLTKLLGKDAHTRKLISPAAAEKLLGKTKSEEIQALIVKPEGAPTLAPSSDPRPALNITVCDFD